MLASKPITEFASKNATAEYIHDRSLDASEPCDRVISIPTTIHLKRLTLETCHVTITFCHLFLRLAFRRRSGNCEPGQNRLRQSSGRLQHGSLEKIVHH